MFSIKGKLVQRSGAVRLKKETHGEGPYSPGLCAPGLGLSSGARVELLNRCTKSSDTSTLVSMEAKAPPGFPGHSPVENPPVNAGDPGSIPGWGSFPGEGNGNPLQYSCPKNPKDRGAWQATVHGVAKESVTT